jgi:hypothetical protein
MIPPTGRWLSRSTFQSRRVPDRKGYGVRCHNILAPSEYTRFALLVLLLFTGSVFLENECTQMIWDVFAN